jgi:hypothetical protein
VRCRVGGWRYFWPPDQELEAWLQGGGVRHSDAPHYPILRSRGNSRNILSQNHLEISFYRKISGCTAWGEIDEELEEDVHGAFASAGRARVRVGAGRHEVNERAEGGGGGESMKKEEGVGVKGAVLILGWRR